VLAGSRLSGVVPVQWTGRKRQVRHHLPSSALARATLPAALISRLVGTTESLVL
jgi:hypothetical protein